MRTVRVVENARKDVAAYVRTGSPTPKDRIRIVEHAIRLARLDAVFRAGYVDPKMDVAEPGDVQDILRLLEIVPYDELAYSKTLWVNPTFGRYSELVGGADCDLVSGNRLIDIKVTKNDAIRQDYMRQLVSYAILARRVRSDEPSWPDVCHVGIYFARRGHLWMVPVDAIFANPAHAEVEAWYFDRAAEEFGTPLADLAPRKPRRKTVVPAVSVKVKVFSGRAKPLAKTGKKGTRKKRSKK